MTHQTAIVPLEIYQLHILLLKISPAIWRRVQVRSDSTLADLHRVIQLSMGWQDEHLNRFVIHVTEYAVAKLGGGWGANEAEGVHLKDVGCERVNAFFTSMILATTGGIKFALNKSCRLKRVRVNLGFTPFVQVVLVSLRRKDVVGSGLLWI